MIINIESNGNIYLATPDYYHVFYCRTWDDGSAMSELGLFDDRIVIDCSCESVECGDEPFERFIAVYLYGFTKKYRQLKWQLGEIKFSIAFLA
jgi:hypothetical protein